MSDNRPPVEVGVDRRVETVSTQQPGYAATEQVTTDAAAEQRLGFSKVTQIVWIILGAVEILLGLRFVLKLIAANAGSGFAVFIYGVTKPFVAPFTALIGTPTSGNTVFEGTTLIAMAVYALFVWIVVRLLHVAGDRPSARTTTRSTRERTG